MEDNKGICFFFDNRKMIIKTKFDNEKDCQERINSLLNIGVMSKDNTPYKCKECGFWHAGKPGQSKKYGV